MPVLDEWDDGPERRPDGWDRKVRAALDARDHSAAAHGGSVSDAADQSVQDAVAEQHRHAPPPAGEWRPDEWDQKVRAVLAWRNHIADSVDGPMPAVGSAEWAVADEHTKAAAYARHERAAAEAQGRAISNRMAAEATHRAADREAQRAMADEWARRGYSRDPLRASVREQREADRARRAAASKPWEDGYARSFRPTSAVPAQREATDTRECVQRASAAAACAAARHAARTAVTDDEQSGGSAEDEAEAHVDVRT